MSKIIVLGSGMCGLAAGMLPAKHQIQVGVAPRSGAVDQPYFDVIGGTHTRRWHLGAAKPAQRHEA